MELTKAEKDIDFKLPWKQRSLQKDRSSYYILCSLAFYHIFQNIDWKEGKVHEMNELPEILNWASEGCRNLR